MCPHSVKSIFREPPGVLFAQDELSNIGEEHYRALIEMLPVVVWMTEADGSTSFCNQHWYEFSGLTVEQTVGRGWASVLHPDDRQRALELWQGVAAADGVYMGEQRFRRAADGEYRWHFAKGIPLKDAGGRVVKWVGVAVDIHDRKMAEKELAEKEEQLCLAIEAAQLGTWGDSLDGGHLKLSYRSKAIFGLQPETDLTFTGFLALVHPDDRPRLEAALASAKDPEGFPEFEMEYRIVRSDGSLHWIASRGKCVFSGTGSLCRSVQMIGTVQDITGKKLAEEALKSSESRLRAILAAEPECVKLLTADYRLCEMNAAGLSIIEADSIEQVMGKELLGLVHEKYRPEFEKLSKQVFDGQPGALDYEITGLKGTHRWLQIHATPLRNKEGEVEFLLGVTRDITKQKAAEEALRASEDKFKRAFRCSPDAMSITTAVNGTYLDVNDAFLRMSGYRREEVIGRTALEAGIWANSADRQQMLETLKTQRIQAMEMRFRTKTGEVLYAHFSVEAIEIGGTQCLLAITHDITQQVKAAEKLRRSEEQYRSLIDCAPYGIFRTSREGSFQMVNPALIRMLGYETAEEMYALDLATEVYEERGEHDRILKMIEVQLDESPTSQLQRLETTWRRKDGKIISVRMAARPSRDDQGRLLQAEIFVENVTEQKALEKQLQTAQKMDAIGQLAGGVAHDFNNLLMIIGSRAELIIEGLMRPERVVAQAEEIVRATRGAAAVTRQLLAFSRKQTLQPAVLDLNPLLLELGKMLPRLIGEQIETRVITMPRIGRVKVDPGQFEQVIMNLAINARDAMPGGGELIIQTSFVDLDSNDAARHPTVTPGRYVLLTVTDTGIGMDTETQAHIFEPFFTTKERGRGTGLGLAMVYGIVQQSGGHISVVSSPGVGTRFRIYLPEVESAYDPAQTEQSLPAPGGSETILFVEDEKALRDVGCEFLRSKGYEVLEAANGAEALKILKAGNRPIHLLITDVIMPTMSGPELVRRAVALQPRMRAIYMSGYSAGTVDGTDQSHEIFLQKPFSMTTLARHTRTALDRPVEPIARLA